MVERQPVLEDPDAPWWPVGLMLALQLGLGWLALNKGAGIVSHGVAAWACLLAPAGFGFVYFVMGVRLRGLRARPTLNWERELGAIIRTETLATLGETRGGLSEVDDLRGVLSTHPNAADERTGS